MERVPRDRLSNRDGLRVRRRRGCNIAVHALELKVASARAVLDGGIIAFNSEARRSGRFCASAYSRQPPIVVTFVVFDLPPSTVTAFCAPWSERRDLLGELGAERRVRLSEGFDGRALFNAVPEYDPRVLSPRNRNGSTTSVSRLDEDHEPRLTGRDQEMESLRRSLERRSGGGFTLAEV